MRKLDEPRTYETHPTYIYSAPLGGNEDSRRVFELRSKTIRFIRDYLEAYRRIVGWPLGGA